MDSKVICIFSALYLPSLGGAERYTHNLAKALVRAGKKVIIVTSALEDDEGITCDAGITIIRIPSILLLNNRFAMPRRGKSLARLMDWLDAQPIDYVLVNQRFYPTSIFGLKYAERRGLPAITLDHGSAHITMSNFLLDKVIETYEHTITAVGKRYPSRYYAVSEKSAEWLSHFNIKASGLLHNAIDADDFVATSSHRDFRGELGLADDDFLVVFTGRLMKEKGVLDACRAVALLVNEGRNNIHLVIAGDGPLAETIKSQDAPYIHLLGTLTSEDISALLSQCQAFCLPTASEGFSTSMLEAAAHGLGIVVTDTGGARELIPNDSYGIVLQNVSPESVALALNAFIDQPAYLKECGRNVSKRVRELFSWDQTAIALIDAFRK